MKRCAFVLLACGCSETQTGSLQPTPPPIEPPVADILFVLDNSIGSLSEHERLIAAFPRLLAPLDGADLRIGVVSTDASSIDGEREGKVRLVYSPDFPWILTNFEVNECRNITPRLEHGCAHGEILDSKALEPGELLEGLRKITDAVGNCGPGLEQATKATISALDHRLDCNAALLRDEALLVVIHVGDDVDFSGLNTEEVLASLAVRKPMDRVRLAMIVGEVDGEAADCGVGLGRACGSLCDASVPQGSHSPCTRNLDCTDGEICGGNQCENPQLQFWGSCAYCTFYRAPDCCEADGGDPFVDLARALGDKALLGSVCDEDYGDTLERIATELIIGSVDGGG